MLHDYPERGTYIECFETFRIMLLGIDFILRLIIIILLIILVPIRWSLILTSLMIHSATRPVTQRQGTLMQKDRKEIIGRMLDSKTPSHSGSWFYYIGGLSRSLHCCIPTYITFYSYLLQGFLPQWNFYTVSLNFEIFRNLSLLWFP